MTKGGGRMRYAAALALVMPAAPAAALELYQYDANGDGTLDREELRVKALHDTVPVYDEIDVIVVDGVFSQAELEAFYARSEQKAQRAETSLVKTAGPDESITVPELYDIEKMRRCGDGGRFFLRGAKPETGVASSNDPGTVTTGASLAITDKDNTTTATVNGVAGYIISYNCLSRPEGVGPTDPYLSGYVVAPWISANGTLFTEGETPDTSKLKAGVDAQFEISNVLFNLQYLTLSPYFQTDFSGDAEIYGGMVSWEPRQSAIRLGGVTRPEGALLDFYWTAKGVADYRYVAKAGASGLTDGAEYAWLGGTLGLNGWLFPNALDSRLFFTTEYSAFWDAYSDRTVDLFKANLGWDLTPDKSTAIRLGYQRGTDKDTLTKVNQVDLSLTFKK